jgi:hypothetical protein
MMVRRDSLGQVISMDLKDIEEYINREYRSARNLLHARGGGSGCLEPSWMVIARIARGMGVTLRPVERQYFKRKAGRVGVDVAFNVGQCAACGGHVALSLVTVESHEHDCQEWAGEMPPDPVFRDGVLGCCGCMPEDDDK